MKQQPQGHAAHLDPDEASPSLRDVAAYLRGVADATNALSQPPAPTRVLHSEVRPVVSASALGETLGENLSEECSTPFRRTMPYDGQEGWRADTIPAGVDGSGVEDSPEEPFLDERASEVRLRVGPLSPEWYALLNTRVG
jgi:hypothetical protein